MRSVAAIIVAAGRGKRFGQMKQFVYLKAKPVLEWTLEAFDHHPEINSIILVLPDESDRKHYQMRYPKIKHIVRGGETRQDSVWQGFRLIDSVSVGVVLIHDGSRPLVSAELISRVISNAEQYGAVVPVIQVEDTLKEVAGDRVVKTLDRNVIMRAQTPQGFKYSLLKEALESARKDRCYGTDETFLLEKKGHHVHAVAGDPRNIKITTPGDLKIAEVFLGD